MSIDARGSSPATLRRINSRAILGELFHDEGSHTVTELATAVGLSRPTVEAALADLVAEGWVTEVDAIATPNKAGRRAKRFRAEASAGYVVGVDLGLHAIVGIVSDLRGTPIATVEETYPTLASAEQAWRSVREVIARLTDRIDVTKLLSATFGVPAVVDRSGAIDYTIAVPDWVSARIPGRIGDLFPGAATFFDNDAKLAAIAEAMWGRFVGVQDGLSLVMGRQIGAALIVNGTLARGVRGAAGEVGGLASTGWPGVPAELEARIPAGLDLEQCMRAAGAGDPAAVAVVEWLAGAVATGVAQLVATVDPERVVVGGEVLPAGTVFTDALATEVAARTGATVPIVPSAVGRDAVARGALAHSLGHVRSEHMGLG
ncbi:ROK family protein [Curtobacterium sp. RRHDQ10]|uniref:ROK family transcriptional regulator n=1 Tax=Curtobacterium phyllosphaerae TaxID=3413379 RepID=UPI003BF3C2BC